MKIEEKHVTRDFGQVFTADAAELGFPRSMRDWPDRLETELGNGEPLIKMCSDPTKAVYGQVASLVKLKVFNT